MKKTSVLLAAGLLGAGTLHAQSDYLNDERTDASRRARIAPSDHNARGHWTAYGHARDDKQVMPAYERPQVFIGKFFGDGWAVVNGRRVFLPNEILPVAWEDASFSAESLNARRVRLADGQ